jgi:hypothetical protein
MDDSSMDLRDTRGRLRKLAIAAAIGAVLTFFTVKAMTSSGGSNHDPVGASIMPLLGIFIFVLTTAFANKILSKKR